jgi:hypothetical protein
MAPLADKSDPFSNGNKATRYTLDSNQYSNQTLAAFFVQFSSHFHFISSFCIYIRILFYFFPVCMFSHVYDSHNK